MRKRRRLLIAALVVVALIAAHAWLISYLAWRADLRAAGFVGEMEVAGAGQRLLVVSPHPDDEVVGCGGLIQQATAAGAEVHVALMTNGDASELALIFGERELPLSRQAFINLGSMRQQESLRALRYLGVSERRVHFLGFPNNGLLTLWRLEHWPYSALYRSPYSGVSFSPYARCFTPGAPYCGQQVLADLKALLYQVKPDAIFVTHPQDIHPDHWASACFVLCALATLARQGEQWAAQTRVYGYLVHWPRYPAPRRLATRLPLLPPAELVKRNGAWVRLPLSPQQARRKLAATRLYRSQQPSFGRLLLAFARANDAFELLPQVEMAPGFAHTWEDENSHRRLDGVEITSLRLDISDGLAVNARLASAAHPLGDNGYLALDLRTWDDAGAPDITSVYVHRGARVSAVRLDGAQQRRLPAVARELRPGSVETTGVRLPSDNALPQQVLVTCWGSIRDRATDPAVVSLVELRRHGDLPPSP